MQRAQLDVFLAAVLRQLPRLSDILFSPGAGVRAGVDGALVPVRTRGAEEFPARRVREAVECLLDQDAARREDLAARGSCDFSLRLADGSRFRVDVFRERGGLGAALRRLPERVPSMEELGLPPVFRDIAGELHGLALVTGGTGTGKSSSLAALVQAINAERATHVITLEDPVEFLHAPGRGVVTQRELHTDFDSFASGLRAALRQAPGVIMVGEIRDRETLEVALQAADTGHLVLSTLHTADAGATVGRMLGLFEPGEERLMRRRLAECLRYVVSQRLLPRIGGGRVAAFEVLRSTLRVRDLILEGESGERTFYGVLEQGGPHGMQTFDQHLVRLYEAGLIGEDTAVYAAGERSELVRMLDRVKTARGEADSDLRLGGLETDLDADLRRKR